MKVGRYTHAASVLINGNVLVSDGSYYYYEGGNMTELYNLSIETWEGAGEIILQRAYHTSTVLANGDVLVTGGATNGPIDPNTAELYKPATKTFVSIDNMIHVESSHKVFGFWTKKRLNSNENNGVGVNNANRH
jgi:hypothetical protein